MTGGMMGRTSDTRIYNPRSESSEMFVANHEDERPPSGVQDGKDKENRRDKRQDKKEAEEKEDKKIRHIKVRSHHLGLGGKIPTEEMDEDESGKDEAEKEIHNQTMPSGAGGFMTSLAMGAKGPGAAGGEMIQMSEPMDMAWQLLKEEEEEEEGHRINFNTLSKTPKETWLKQIMGFDMPTISNMVDMGMMKQLGFDNHMHGDPDMMNEMYDSQHIWGPQESMDSLMEHRNSLIYLNGMMEGKLHQIPDWVEEQHNNAMITQELGHDNHPIPHIAGNLAALYTHANYLGNMLGPEMQEPDEDWQNKLTGEPMDIAYQLLKKELPHITWMSPQKITGWIDGHLMMFGLPRWAANNPHTESISNLDERGSILNDINDVSGKNDYSPPTEQEQFTSQMFDESGNLKGEPMNIAYQLLKSDRSVARRRKKEGYAKWRPSTGQFERPKGGGSPHTATSRRAKNISRNLPEGKKTGIQRAHLAVEMSHRGLASKQPMSKDPQKYGAYQASQEARKLQGGVRSTYTPHMRSNQRSFISGQTGGGRLTNTLQYPRVPRPRLHQVRAPGIVPPKMKMPHLTRPKMPGMVTMSEDTPHLSDILKSGNAYQAALMRITLKEIRELMREKKDKDRKQKGKGNPDVAGAASTLPNYEANNPKTATRPQGGTEDENDSRLWGLSPGDLVGGSGRV